eukprot:4314053-Prymnesium_polylepis.1
MAADSASGIEFGSGADHRAEPRIYLVEEEQLRLAHTARRAPLRILREQQLSDDRHHSRVRGQHDSAVEPKQAW